jgi:hypothetical protein
MKKILSILLVAALFTACSDKPTDPFTILKSATNGNGKKMDVQIGARLSKQQMVAIASKIRKDSSQYENLQLNFCLPGNSEKNLGGIIIYATASYKEPRKVTPADTVIDLHDNRLEFSLLGFTPQEAKKLLTLNPEHMETKTLLGRFIDDDTRTVSVVYKDGKEEDQICIMEFDRDGKVVSATQPLEVTHNGVQKLVISQNGDYMTLTNGMLTMYGSSDPEKPYRSLKQGL